MEKCLFCGKYCKDTLFKNDTYCGIKHLYDDLTGVTFCLCKQCGPKYFKPVCKLLEEKDGQPGIRGVLRRLSELNLLSQSSRDFINKETVRLLSNRYLGQCTGYIVYNHGQYLLFDETSRKMLINGSSVCSFNDVLDYKVLDHSSNYNIHSPEHTEYSNRSKNALGRAILGKAFAGDAGAIVGGLTAKHGVSVGRSGYSSYTTTSHEYSIVIRLNKLGFNSCILTVGESEAELSSLCNALDIVISLKE